MIFFGKKSCFKNVEKDDSPVGLSALRLKKRAARKPPIQRKDGKRLFVLDNLGRAAFRRSLDVVFILGIVDAFLDLHLIGNAENRVAGAFAGAARNALVARFVQPNFFNCHRFAFVLL